MTSIARTFALSLGIAATTIFLIMLGLFIWRYPMEEREFRACRVVAAVLDRATMVEGQNLTVRPTPALEELKVDSPNLWYVVSAGDMVSEYGSERRPALPFAFPYHGLSAHRSSARSTRRAPSASPSCKGVRCSSR
ncbi:two-component hybrid sensor and regulator [Bradyrhizobium diazoefficiens]|uniref:Two-component hybrid sensor and regulator n=1 Tax=Bradyrhizobium diazoefficiens TaxID=1355477 RepID=A0A0E3VSG3_9BRAD|nr:two-component hybrid sensor and regulator [Bradyrhizobium diazoefficiens]